MTEDHAMQQPGIAQAGNEFAAGQGALVQHGLFQGGIGTGQEAQAAFLGGDGIQFAHGNILTSYSSPLPRCFRCRSTAERHCSTTSSGCCDASMMAMRSGSSAAMVR